MKKRIITIGMALCLLLTAGCAKKAEPSGLIMANVKDTAMPYGVYRGYIDAFTEISRLSAIRNFAFSAAVEKDLTGVFAFSREEFEAKYAYQVIYMMEDANYAKNVELAKAALKLTDDDLKALLLELYWPQYMSEKMSEKFVAQAAATGTTEDELWTAYQTSLATRTSYDQPNVPFTIDGKAIELTKVQQNTINLNKMMTRIEEINTVALLDYLYKDLTVKGMTLDTTGFDAYVEQNLASIKSDETYSVLVPKAIKEIGMTEENFNESFKSYLKLQFGIQQVVTFLGTQYDAMTGTDKPATSNEYVNQYAIDISNNITISNLS